MSEGSGERLARVTYLPGVKPPSAPDDRVSLDEIPGLIRGRDVDPNTSKPAMTPIGETRSDRAHNVGPNALARRGMSSKEMADLLTRRGLEDDQVEDEVERLEDVGLLDDDELARTLVRTLIERKGLGRTAVRAELTRRRIDAEIISDALDEYFEDEGVDELTRARELAIKRAPQLRSLDPETARRRLGAFLMRKGYSGSIVASAVATALAPNHPAVRKSGDGPRFV